MHYSESHDNDECDKFSESFHAFIGHKVYSERRQI